MDVLLHWVAHKYLYIAPGWGRVWRVKVVRNKLILVLAVDVQMHSLDLYF